MRRIGGPAGWGWWLALLLLPVCASGASVRIVAAENFYGDVARQIGGADVQVSSILANPDQDPHLFEISPSVARLTAQAGIVIENGLAYDPWMDRMLMANAVPGRRVIAAGRLAGREPGDNPHIWYDPAIMAAVAGAVAADCAAEDPAHAAAYEERLRLFTASLAPIRARIETLRLRFRGAQVTATEPVFGYMLAALGIVSRDQSFQRAQMNGTEIGATDLSSFEDDLRSRRVRLLVFNRQASDAVADRMKAVAQAAGIPILGASETEPTGSTYQSWLSGELDALESALAKAPP